MRARSLSPFLSPSPTLSAADDNHYPAHTVPELRISIAQDGTHLTFDNNEVGFTPKNVRALCSMGESTKLAADPRFIGNKGIGFKSVFKMTSRPRVHSRQFHLQFDASDGGLGYIIPAPVAAPEGWDPSIAGTRIVLPLEAAGQSTKLRDFRVNLAELKPSLLLFLRRLRHLEMADPHSGWRRSIRLALADDDGASTVALLEDRELGGAGSGEGSSVGVGGGGGVWTCHQQRWLLVRKALDAKVARLGIARTEIVLAFPLDARTPYLPPQDVCAFLPLRSYGLRFLLQADWEIPSSRESVDASSAWNQWLRDEVPQLFLAAAEAFVRRVCATPSASAASVASAASAASAATAATAGADSAVPSASSTAATAPPSLSDEAIASLALFMQCVPLRGQCTDFFMPLAAPCCALLRTCRCLPTRGGQLARPAELVLWQAAEHDPATQQTEALLAELLGLQPLHAKLTISEALADELGVRRIDARLVYELLVVLTSRPDAPPIDFEWLAWAFELLQRDAALSALLPLLRALPLVPLSGGGWGSATQSPIYEIDDGLRTDGGSSLEGGLALLQSVTSLRLAHPAFVRAVNERRDARCLLARLKVQKLGRHDLVMAHVVPALAAPATASEALPGLLAYARMQSLSCTALADGALQRALLDAGARLLSSTAEPFTLRRVAGDVPMALSESGTPLQLCPTLCEPEANLLPAGFTHASWPTVSEAYHLLATTTTTPNETQETSVEPEGIAESVAKPDVAGWRDFFVSLGVVAFPIAAPRPWQTVAVAEDDGLTGGVGGAADAAVPMELADENEECGFDWASPALDALLTALIALADLASLERLLDALLEQWPTLRSCGALGVSCGRGTALLSSLRGTAWLVSNDGELRRPSELWMATDEVTAVLGRSVAYASAELPLGIASALGMQVSLEPSRLLALVASWSDAAEDASHRADAESIAQLYIWLGGVASSDGGELRRKLANRRCIWVPRRGGGTGQREGIPLIDGDFFVPSECVWCDNSDLVERAGSGAAEGDGAADSAELLTAGVHLRVLDAYYMYPAATQEAFRWLGVSPSPSLEQYTQILTAASALQSVSAIAASFRVYAVLGSWLREEASHAADGVAAEDWNGGGARLAVQLRSALSALPLPVASNAWAACDDVHFVITGEEATVWGEPTQRHAVLLLDVDDEAFESAVSTYLQEGLGLSPLAACVSEHVEMRGMPPVELMRSARSSARAVAVAGVLQRLSAAAGCCTPEQREVLAAALRELRIHHASSLDCYRQVRAPTAAADTVIERQALASSRCRAFLLLPGASHPADAHSTSGLIAAGGTAGGATGGVTSAAAAHVLFWTEDATPRDWIVEFGKLLPSALEARASLALFPLLHHIWEWERPTAELLGLVLGEEHGLSELPPLPTGETLWVDMESVVGDAAADPMRDARLAEDMRRAQQREQRSLTNAADAASTDLLVAASAAGADGQVDEALQRAMAGRQASRELASLRKAQEDAPPLAAPVQQAHPEAGPLRSAPDPRDVSAPPTAWLSSADVVDGIPTQAMDVEWRAEQLSPELFSLPSLGPVERAQVGRWGEQLCYEHLRRRLGTDPRVVIDWQNRDVESGLPYVRTTAALPLASNAVRPATATCLRRHAPGACSRTAPRLSRSDAHSPSSHRPVALPASFTPPCVHFPWVLTGSDGHLLFG